MTFSNWILFDRFPNKEEWKYVFMDSCFQNWKNIIVINIFSISYAPICISFLFNWIWIPFNVFKLCTMSLNISFKWNFISKSQFFFSISWSSLIVCNAQSPSWVIVLFLRTIYVQHFGLTISTLFLCHVVIFNWL